jgi:hypothetical protein
VLRPRPSARLSTPLQPLVKLGSVRSPFAARLPPPHVRIRRLRGRHQPRVVQLARNLWECARRPEGLDPITTKTTIARWTASPLVDGPRPHDSSPTRKPVRNVRQDSPDDGGRGGFPAIPERSSLTYSSTSSRVARSGCASSVHVPALARRAAA